MREWEQDEEYQKWLNNPTYKKYVELNESRGPNLVTVAENKQRIECLINEASTLRKILDGMSPETLPNTFAKLKECDTMIGECTEMIENAIATDNKIKSEMLIIGDELLGLGYEPYGISDDFIYVIPNRVRYGAMERNVKRGRESGGVVEYNRSTVCESRYVSICDVKKWYEFWKW